MAEPGEIGKICSTVLPPSTSSIPEARHFTTDAIADLGGCGHLEDAELLVSELATNAVIHAGTPIRLSVLRRGPHVRVEVRDDDPRPPAGSRPEPMAQGGRGMPLVEHLARAWGINGNARGKTVWFEV